MKTDCFFVSLLYFFLAAISGPWRSDGDAEDALRDGDSSRSGQDSRLCRLPGSSDGACGTRARRWCWSQCVFVCFMCDVGFFLQARAIWWRCHAKERLRTGLAAQLPESERFATVEQKKNQVSTFVCFRELRVWPSRWVMVRLTVFTKSLAQSAMGFRPLRWTKTTRKSAPSSLATEQNTPDKELRKKTLWFFFFFFLFFFLFFRS
jgi:hypothetical protein